MVNEADREDRHKDTKRQRHKETQRHRDTDTTRLPPVRGPPARASVCSSLFSWQDKSLQHDRKCLIKQPHVLDISIQVWNFGYGRMWPEQPSHMCFVYSSRAAGVEEKKQQAREDHPHLPRKLPLANPLREVLDLVKLN